MQGNLYLEYGIGGTLSNPTQNQEPDSGRMFFKPTAMKNKKSEQRAKPRKRKQFIDDNSCDMLGITEKL